MAFAYPMDAKAVTTMVMLRDNTLLFVLLSGVVLFG